MKLKVQAGETKGSSRGNKSFIRRKQLAKSRMARKSVGISKGKYKDGRGKGVGYTASATILHHYPTHY